MSAESAKQFLSTYVAGHLVNKKQPVVSISEKSTIKSTLSLLKEKKILSLPVAHSAPKKGELPFIGIVNVWDIVTVTCFQGVFDQYDDEKLDIDILNDPIFSDALSLAVFDKPISDIVGSVSEEGKTLWVYDWDETLDKLLEAFSKGVHRVLIRGLPDEGPAHESAEYRFLSQTDVIRFLYEQRENFSDFLSLSLSSLGLISKTPIIACSTDSSALTAFRKITLHDISALPIVDPHGKLVSTLSASDVRGLDETSFKYTLLSVMEFLEKVRGEKAMLNNFVARESDSLLSVIQTTVQKKVHRVWVVNEADEPVGSVSLTDIICKFSPNDYKVGSE